MNKMILKPYPGTHKIKTENGMSELHRFFPSQKADGDNLVMFSTSGVHGTYATIEDIENEEYEHNELTFLIIQPRRVLTLYGNCRPETPEDFAFLRSLRESSRIAIAEL